MEEADCLVFLIHGGLMRNTMEHDTAAFMRGLCTLPVAFSITAISLPVGGNVFVLHPL